MNMDFEIEFSEEKNQLLKKTRGICFDDVIELIEKDNIIDDIDNKSKNHKTQSLLIIKIKNYVYAIPYVKDLINKKMFLKTIYPSRFWKKKYAKKL